MGLIRVVSLLVSHIAKAKPETDGMHWWFSGRMLACHAGDPGPIPG